MTESDLLDLMTRPSSRLVRDMLKIDNDIMLLGCGGKIGPHLAIMAKRAMTEAGLRHRVYGVSLFDYPESAEIMRKAGVSVIEADLFNQEQLKALPDIKNIIYMAGRKFGTHQNQPLTWAINVLLPAKICERFHQSNIVLFSTGNVYRYMPVSSSGSCEKDLPEPVGEYGQSCLGRERIFHFYSDMNQSSGLIFRLNYSVDMRYGVLFDIARNIMENVPINQEIGYFNCIWQGDVCEYAIRSLLHCSNPPLVLNVSGPESISIRWAAEKLGELLGKEPIFSGNDLPEKSLFSNTAKLNQIMGYPNMSLGEMIKLTAEWLKSGGSYINAPTHFETTDGKF